MLGLSAKGKQKGTGGMRGEGLGGFATGEGSGRAGGEERRQPAGSYGLETALPGSQMGEQVLHLASSSSVEQSCHRALKEASELQQSPSLGTVLPCSSLRPSR